MKRLILLFAVTLALLLGACGGATTLEPDSTEPTKESDTIHSVNIEWDKEGNAIASSDEEGFSYEVEDTNDGKTVKLNFEDE